MFHCAAYFESQATGVSNDALKAVTDQVLTISNNNFLLREDRRLLYACAVGLELTNARLSSPSINVITRPSISPLEPAALPRKYPGIADYRQQPFQLYAREELSIETTKSSGGSTGDVWGVIGVEWNPQPCPPGPIYSLYGTATTTLTVDNWSELTDLTWTNSLPQGTYSVCGLSVYSATAIAARLIIQNQVPRPGIVASADVTTTQEPMFSYGEMGEYGRFESFVMPQVEVLAHTADTAQSVVLQVIRVG